MDLQESVCKKFLNHYYDIPKELPKLPLNDELFVSRWQKADGKDVLRFFTDVLGLAFSDFKWENMEALSISFAETLGGRLPIITTQNHRDLLYMDALLNGREKIREIPPTVNAFTMQTKAKDIFCHRIILMNIAPYSNVPADKIGLGKDEWLILSQKIRLAHEITHYETLRLFGGMKNHPLDEIVADAFGQIAAFGNYNADRQRLFFGLEKGKDTCKGRLSFYTANIPEEEKRKVYLAVNQVLDDVEIEVKKLLSFHEDKIHLLTALAGKSLLERLN